MYKNTTNSPIIMSPEQHLASDNRTIEYRHQYTVQIVLFYEFCY